MFFILYWRIRLNNYEFYDNLLKLIIHYRQIQIIVTILLAL